MPVDLESVSPCVICRHCPCVAQMSDTREMAHTSHSALLMEMYYEVFIFRGKVKYLFTFPYPVDETF